MAERAVDSSGPLPARAKRAPRWSECGRIIEFRDQARRRLRARFSMLDFHDVALKTESVPLDVLGEVVNVWVEST